MLKCGRHVSECLFYLQTCSFVPCENRSRVSAQRQQQLMNHIEDYFGVLFGLYGVFDAIHPPKQITALQGAL